MIVLNAAATVFGDHKLSYLARSHNASFFHQSWDLFVPPPHSNYTLFASFENNGIQKKEIFSDIVIQHQTSRLKGYGPLVVALSNCMSYFEQSTPLQASINGPVKNDIHFMMIETAARNYLQAAYRSEITSLRLTLVVEEAESRRKRIYFD